MQNTTIFNVSARYIVFPIFVTTKDGDAHELDALLDTGAPRTEFSDEALQAIGFLETPKKDIVLKPGLQTQKYSKVVLPHLSICNHPINNLEVYVSHFEKSWGIKALIGLDFFRRFRITVDYYKGQIIASPHTANNQS